MAFPDKLLARDEQVVLRCHPHVKVLALPAVLFVLIIAAASFMITWISGWDDAGFTTHRWWFVAVVAVAVVLLVVCSVRPWVRWQAEHFVLTTGHVLFRTGVIHRRSHQIALSRVQNVESSSTIPGRILRYGALVIDSASDEPLEFSTLPSPNRVQRTLNQLVADARARDQGEPADGARPAG